MILIEDVGKVYDNSIEKVNALKKVNLKIKEGENVVVVGKSGSGKSTLLNIISGIDKPSSGNITIKNTLLNEMSEAQLAKWRGNNVGIVFQFYQLLPTLSAIDNILFAMNLVKKIDRAQRRKRAKKLLAQVELSHKANNFPHQLSGGERQRVAIARALANNPILLVADEPTGNLDSKTGKVINQLFTQLSDHGTTLVKVTHAHVNKEEYDRVITISDGIISENK